MSAVDWSTLTPAEFAEQEEIERRKREAAVRAEFGDDPVVRAQINAIDSSDLKPEEFSRLDNYLRGNASSADIRSLIRIAERQQKGSGT